MWDTIIQYLVDNSSAGIWLLIGGVVAWFVSDIIHRIKKAEEKIEKLPLPEHFLELKNEMKDIRRTMDDFIQSVKDYIRSNDERLNEMSAWIMKTDVSMIDTLKRYSPLSMTPAGKILFEQMPARKLVDDNLEYLIKEIEERDPATPYDVEEIALRVMIRNINHPMYNELKNYIYYSPETISIKDPETNKEKNVAINMNVAMRLMSIYLRDLYLEAHAGLTQSAD
ncbi:MAG: hypothetical protein LBQ65_08530 [Tannerellaceae bacterium]|jgi:hypothetical protein|nr:hypothetical protein [Tannerellaceae bacterium]